MHEGIEEQTEDDKLKNKTDKFHISERNGKEGFPRDYFLVMATAQAFETKTSAKINGDDLNEHIIKVKSKSEAILVITDSGSLLSFIKKKTAQRLHDKDKSASFKKIRTIDAA